MRSHHIVPAWIVPNTSLSAGETPNDVNFATELDSYVRAAYRRMKKVNENRWSKPLDALFSSSRP